jgi:P27 family predicted phage terminase small subunit
MRGQRPKTEEEAWLTGTQASRATVPAVSVVPVGRPAKPKNVSKDALKIFRKLCGLLRQRRALTPGDGEILRLYCTLYDRHQRALAALASEGEVVAATRMSKSGEPYTVKEKNPWLDIARDAERQQVAILDRLGLTPRAKDAVRPGKQPAPVETTTTVLL